MIGREAHAEHDQPLEAIDVLAQRGVEVDLEPHANVDRALEVHRPAQVLVEDELVLLGVELLGRGQRAIGADGEAVDDDVADHPLDLHTVVVGHEDEPIRQRPGLRRLRPRRLAGGRGRREQELDALDVDARARELPRRLLVEVLRREGLQDRVDHRRILDGGGQRSEGLRLHRGVAVGLPERLPEGAGGGLVGRGQRHRGEHHEHHVLGVRLHGLRDQVRRRVGLHDPLGPPRSVRGDQGPPGPALLRLEAAGLPHLAPERPPAGDLGRRQQLLERVDLALVGVDADPELLLGDVIDDHLLEARLEPQREQQDRVVVVELLDLRRGIPVRGERLLQRRGHAPQMRELHPVGVDLGLEHRRLLLEGSVLGRPDRVIDVAGPANRGESALDLLELLPARRLLRGELRMRGAPGRELGSSILVGSHMISLGLVVGCQGSMRDACTATSTGT
ncbi:hypothetical protein [Nannocystis pusilla]|uniref:hypothetical protein n=1 Tax=Nannocystis pusilla TaxID=889268 RepID=UPI003DA2F501